MNEGIDDSDLQDLASLLLRTDSYCAPNQSPADTRARAAAQTLVSGRAAVEHITAESEDLRNIKTLLSELMT